MSTHTIYQKLAKARMAFHALDIKKSGRNDYAGYSYFEMRDFLLHGMQCFHDAGLVPLPICFTAEEAVFTIVEAEGEGVIKITSPMASASLKAAHEIQNLGAVETYQRRYLWALALELVEQDTIDSGQGAAPRRISDDGITSIVQKMEESGADNERFLKWVKSQFKVDSLDKLNTEQEKQVHAMLDAKIAKMKEAA